MTTPAAPKRAARRPVTVRDHCVAAALHVVEMHKLKIEFGDLSTKRLCFLFEMLIESVGRGWDRGRDRLRAQMREAPAGQRRAKGRSAK